MNFFRRNNKKSDPESIISSCLNSLYNRISDDLERKGYYWNKSWGVKRYESIVLSKFILDHSFESLTKEDVSEEGKSTYYFLSNKIFTSLFDEEFSEIGINSENMKEENDKKIQDYLLAYEDTSQNSAPYDKIYMLITGSDSPEKLEKEINRQRVCLKFLKCNDKFLHLLPDYKKRLKLLEQQASAFKLAEVMLPHMMRSARHKIKDINVKKLKSLGKKLLKKENKK